MKKTQIALLLSMASVGGAFAPTFLQSNEANANCKTSSYWAKYGCWEYSCWTNLSGGQCSFGRPGGCKTYGSCGGKVTDDDNGGGDGSGDGSSSDSSGHDHSGNDS